MRTTCTTALKAFGDVENALSSEFALQQREKILATAATDAEHALRLSEIRYRVGSGDLRSVQQTAACLQHNQDDVVARTDQRRVQRVNLHLALGGDFAAGA